MDLKGSSTGRKNLARNTKSGAKNIKSGARTTKSAARLNDAENTKGEGSSMFNVQPNGPPDGFQFVLPFLELSSLLNVERLNKPLKQAVKDPLLWVDMKVEGPACKKLTNTKLLKLVNRADGHLKSLFLADAPAITDNTLRKISNRNPGLERISVPGCTAVNVEKFVSLVENHSRKARAKGLPGIRQVRLGGLYYISPEHLLRLEKALGLPGLPQNEAPPSRRYYGHRQSRNKAIDNRPVDVELCPDCKRVELMYDCPNHENGLEGACRVDELSSEDEEDDERDNGKPCRSCINCIPRCEECGTCVRIEPFEESLCSDLLCATCWKDLPQCIECERPACSVHEKECFPHGLNELCDDCILDPLDGFDGNLDSMDSFDDVLYIPGGGTCGMGDLYIPGVGMVDMYEQYRGTSDFEELGGMYAYTGDDDCDF